MSRRPNIYAPEKHTTNQNPKSVPRDKLYAGIAQNGKKMLLIGDLKTTLEYLKKKNTIKHARKCKNECQIVQ